MNFTGDYEQNISFMKKFLHVDQCFDLVFHPLVIGGQNAGLFFLDGMTKDEVLQKLLQSFWTLKESDLSDSPQAFADRYLSYGEVDLKSDSDEAVKALLSGSTCLFLEGYPVCFVIDCRTYPARSVSEPEKNKVLRGSRDGFVETLIFNTALIRRRIRDPRLTMEYASAGESSHTDLALCYMRGRVDEELLSKIRSRIHSLKVDALTMNQESLAECLFPHKWFNPFPKFKFSERPDTTAACILEGNIAILVDNSPAAMILPSSIFDIIEEADDYYFPPITGTYLRASRFLIAVLTLILTPLWLAFLEDPASIPGWLSFIRLSDAPNLPIFFQLLILEFAIDGLRLAAVNTPNMLSTPLSVIAGIVLGEYSVKSGWFCSETMLYMAFVTVANYSQSSFELGYALKFMRIFMLITTVLFGWYGFFLGLLLSFCAVLFNRTIAGKSYLYPLFPFHPKEFAKRIFRTRLPHSLS